MLLEIPQTEPRIVKLIDVLNSQAKPILTRFKKFEATEEKLKEKIEGYVDDEEKPKTEKWKAKQQQKIMAAERYAELIKDNGFDIRRVKSHLISEYGSYYSESLVKELTSLIKNDYWNFLIYKKPKATKLVIDLLDKVHTHYGRNSEGANV